MRIAGEVFAVTGAGDGIGRRTALQLLRRGARVAAVDVSGPGLRGTVALAGDLSGRLTTHVLSVADRAAVRALPEQVVAAHGQVDGLVNVAGVIQRFVRVEDLTLDEIDRVMAVNFWGTVLTTHAFLPLLRQRPRACLVNVSSMGALVPFPGQGAYGASKAAVKLFTETLYAELRGTPVAVTVVLPGAVGTNISANSGVEGPTTPDGGRTPRVTDVEDAARQIVDAVERGRFRVLIGADARALDRFARLSPQRAITTVADRMRALLGL